MIYILITTSICALIFSFYIYKSHNKLANQKAEAYFMQWKLKEEKRIREDAHIRSRSVSFGKTIEHYVPFMENFPVNPGDSHFLGKPIDFIAFTNKDDKKNCSVHLIEIKSGNSHLNHHQTNIKRAIKEGRIHWHEFNVDGVWEHEKKQ